MTQDEQHLQLLSVFYWVAAGFTALISLFPLIHLAVGIGIMLSPPNGNGDPNVPWLAGLFFVVFASVWILAGLGFTACQVLTGRYLRQRRRYLFCLVVAGISCMEFPFGAPLGVFTIIVLTRPAVKQMFESRPNEDQSTPPAAP